MAAGPADLDIELSTARLGNRRVAARARELRPGVLEVDLPRVDGELLALEPYEAVVLWRGQELTEAEALGVEGGKAELELHDRIGPQRRAFYRLSVRLPIQVAAGGGASGSTETLTLDVGGGGAGFLWPEPLERGGPLQLALTLGDVEVRTGGKVAFCRPAHGGHHVGVEFVAIQDRDRTRIIKFVNDELLKRHGPPG